jgi:hypothetical protein
MKRIATVTALCTLTLALGAGAEDPPQSPHGSFVADCNICHVPEAWKPAKVGLEFDHSKFGYVLEGAHVDTPCLLCHLNLEFSQVAGTRCDECHQDVHAGELGTECQTCHSTRSFIDRTDHIRSHRFTRFPLTGMHAAVECSDCHGPGDASAMQFVNTPTECIDCHLAAYQAATPTHTMASFPPSQCASCHTTFGWSSFGGAGFDHSLTAFPLTGSHRAAACEDCHAGNQFAGTPTDCYSCHATDYAAAANPVHSLPSFPTNCAMCHSTVNWSSSTFDHALTGFPLTGAHAAVSCDGCHGGGQYAGTPSDCFACHTADYNATTAPNHAASGLGTDCATCHNTTGWMGAAFANHDANYFRIYSGKHRGRWTDCATCHNQPGNFAAFTCFDCHDHNQTRENSRHQGVSGYSYSSQACYSCHPRA